MPFKPNQNSANVRNTTTNPDTVVQDDDKKCRAEFEPIANARGMPIHRHKLDGLYVLAETQTFWEAFKLGWSAHTQSRKWFKG